MDARVIFGWGAHVRLRGLQSSRQRKSPHGANHAGFFDVQCNASRHVSSTRIRLLCALPARSAKLAETEGFEPSIQVLARMLP